jgi:hypothetical protein
MIDIVEEISRREEKGLPLDIHQMGNDGFFGSYEVVYNDGWMFEYDFDRLRSQDAVFQRMPRMEVDKL